MASKPKESIVRITSSQPGNSDFGTGFVIYRAGKNTYLLTCAHVVRDVGGREHVKAGGYPATVVAEGEPDGVDVAVLMVEDMSNIPPLTLSSSGDLFSAVRIVGFSEYGRYRTIRELNCQLGKQLEIESLEHTSRVVAWDFVVTDEDNLEKGYSGSPLFDSTTSHVIGIVITRRSDKQGTAISTDALSKVWSDIPSALMSDKGGGHTVNGPILNLYTTEVRQSLVQKELPRIQHDAAIANVSDFASVELNVPIEHVGLEQKQVYQYADVNTEIDSVRDVSIDRYLSYVVRQDRDDINERWSFRYVSLSGETINLIQTKYQIIYERLHSEHNQPILLDAIEDALTVHSKFVLIGDPGAGKTTTLKKLRIESARKAQIDSDARIPLLINLSGWTVDFQDLTSFINAQRELQGLPPIHIGQTLLLLDGLNEMSRESYKMRVRDIETWLQVNREASVIISCRTSVYERYLQLSLPKVQIHPLDDERIRNFVHVNIGATNGDKLLAELGLKAAAVRSTHDLIHLVRNPYFLDMILFIYEHNNHQIPSNRGQMFRMVVETLYDREYKKGNCSGLAYDNFALGLGSVALAMQSKSTAIKMPTKWTAKQIPRHLNSEQVWELGVQTSILNITEAKTDKFLSFTHQLLLEYFAAEQLARDLSTVSQFLPTPRYAESKRLSSRWDEVMYTIVGFTNPNKIFNIIADKDPILALDCLKYLPNNTNIVTEIEKIAYISVIKLFESSNIEARRAAINKLIGYGDVGLPYLIHALKTNANKIIKISILEVLAELRPRDPVVIETLVGLLSDQRQVRLRAEAILSEIVDEESSSQMLDDEQVISESLHRPNIQDRIEAVIGGPLPQSLEVTRLLIESVSSYGTTSKRQGKMVAEQWIKSDVDELILILGDMKFDSERQKFTRKAAAWILGDLGERRAVEPLIQALGDRSKRVRTSAALSLGKLGDVRAVQPLMDLLVAGLRVRSTTADPIIAAIIALARIGDVQAIEPLTKALEHNNRHVREAAAIALRILRTWKPV